jgi:cell division protein FtsB
MSGRAKWVWGALAAAAGLALWSAADARGYRRYLALEQDLAGLEARNRDLREQNGRYVQEIQALRQDPLAQERAAREELGFIRPGEIVFNLE